MPKKYWLMKSEPDVFSFDDLKSRPEGTEPWDGIRNYQARNFMRDTMQVGDGILFYHSRCKEPGVVGVAEVASEAYPDPSCYDPKSKYYDSKSSKESPRWVMVDVRWKKDFKRNVSLAELKATPELEEMLVVRKGQRLSIQPVEPEHFKFVCKLGARSAK